MGVNVYADGGLETFEGGQGWVQLEVACQKTTRCALCGVPRKYTMCLLWRAKAIHVLPLRRATPIHVVSFRCAMDFQASASDFDIEHESIAEGERG